MPADTFLAIQKVANGWVALPDGANDLTAVVQVFTTPDDLAGFVMSWALASMGARPVADAPAAPQPHVSPSPYVAEPPQPPPVQSPPEHPQFVTDQPAVASQPPPAQQ